MSELRELSCKEFVELVTDYLEGALPEADRARFDGHLGDCEFCTAYLEQMRQTIRAMGRLPEDAIAPEALDDLLTRFRDWR
jgi:anti-sigma factor RsiW